MTKQSIKEKLESLTIFHGIGIYILAYLITVIVVGVLNIPIGYSGSFLSIFTLIIFAIIFSKTKGFMSSFNIFGRKEVQKDILYAFIIMQMLQLLFVAFIAIVINYTSVDMLMMKPLTDVPIIVYIISSTILAVPMEELLFRGILFKRLNFRLSNVNGGLIISIFLSSLVFGIVHQGVLIPMLMGITLACIYHRYDNLLPNMTVHFLNNVIACILTVLVTYNIFNIYTFAQSTIVQSVFIIIGLIGLILNIKFWKDSIQN